MSIKPRIECFRTNSLRPRTELPTDHFFVRNLFINKLIVKCVSKNVRRKIKDEAETAEREWGHTPSFIPEPGNTRRIRQQHIFKINGSVLIFYRMILFFSFFILIIYVEKIFYAGICNTQGHTSSRIETIVK